LIDWKLCSMIGNFAMCHGFQILSQVDHNLFFSLFIFFYFILQYLINQELIFVFLFTFLYMELLWSHVLGYKHNNLTRVDLDFFLYIFFLLSLFNIELFNNWGFIQFVLYKITLISQLGHIFSSGVRIKYNLNKKLVNTWFTQNW